MMMVRVIVMMMCVFVVMMRTTVIPPRTAVKVTMCDLLAIHGQRMAVFYLRNDRQGRDDNPNHEQQHNRR